MPAVSVTFCDDSDVQKILSQTGAALRIDDDAGAAQWAREEATMELLEYLGFRYTTTAMQKSAWVTRKAAWISAKFYCERRGNPVPGSLADELYRQESGLYARLEQMRTGLRSIPDTMTRKADIPVLSNQRERLKPFPQAVTERGRSTGTPDGYTPFDDQTDPYLNYSI